MKTTTKSTRTKPKLAKKSSASQRGGSSPTRNLIVARAMNSWEEKTARQTAILNFCYELHKEGPNGPKRRECKTNETFAKDLFAEIGGFYKEGQPQDPPNPPLPAIPSKTVFKVFENKKEETDWLVTIVLPAADKPFPDPFMPWNVWRCTWVPY